MQTRLNRRMWLAVLAMTPMLIMAPSAAADYNPADFDTVIDTVYDPGTTVQIRYDQQWLITADGGLTGDRIFQIGRTTDGLLVVLGQAAMGTGSTLGDYGATGTLTVDEGGVLTVAAGYFYLGYNRTAGVPSTGILNILGGMATFNGRTTLPYNTGGVAVVTQSGGASIWNGDVRLGGFASDGDGRMTVSGGTATFNNVLYVGRSSGTAAARFDVVGADATITVNSTLNLYSAATLGFTVNSGGVSMIDVASNAANLSGGTIEMALDGYTPAANAVFDLVRCNGIDISNLSLAAGNVGDWQLQVSGDGSKLQAKYLAVPEPATMALLGLGLFGLVIRRR